MTEDKKRYRLVRFAFEAQSGGLLYWYMITDGEIPMLKIPAKKLDHKYIPESVAERLDALFRQDEIALHIRCVYWLLRLIPSRISEVLGMPISIDCIKPYNGKYVIFIPTWKQNCGNMEPILRSIHIEAGIAGYLLALETTDSGSGVAGISARGKEGQSFCLPQGIELQERRHFSVG